MTVEQLTLFAKEELGLTVERGITKTKLLNRIVDSAEVIEETG